MLIKVTKVKTTLRYYPHPPPPIRLAEIQFDDPLGWQEHKEMDILIQCWRGINLYKLCENLFVKKLEKL